MPATSAQPLDADQRSATLPRVSVELIDDADAQAWDRFVESAPTASAYHRYAWRRVVRQVFGHTTYYFAARDATRQIVGVLPLVRLKSLLFGDFLISLPYFTYGGVVAASDAVAAQLTAAAVAQARELGSQHLELRHSANVCPGWPMRTDKVAMLLPLPDSAEVLLRKLPSKLRSQIKRPLREGAVSAAGGAELLDEFYDVFARTMHALGTPVYPRRFFSAIVDALPEHTRVFVVRLQGKPLAAGLTVARGTGLEIPWAASLRSANALGVNMLLYWNVLEYACERGFKTFDFGRSTPDSGTYRFKKQWGAEPGQLYWHYWLRNGSEPPRLNPANPKYHFAVSAWRRLPLALANRLGPLIVRNLP